MAVTKAARKGGMVAHIMRDDVTSLCGRVMVVIPGGEGKRLCKSCARIKGMVVTTSEITFTELEWEFIRTPRDAFFMSMVHDVLNDYAETGDNDPRRIAIYNAIVEHHTMAATEIVVTNAPGGNRGGDGMVNPNSKSVAKGIVTENQRNALNKMNRFMDSLISQILELEGKEIPAGIGEDLTEEWFAKLKTRADINKAFDAYSRGIDRLKEEVSKLRSAARVEERKAETKASKLSHGDICCKDGEFFKVTESQRGFLYVTMWDGESWNYDMGKGKLKTLTPENIATAEQAAQFGHMFHRCVFCTRPLSREESEAVGYGPDCAENRGLPWG